MSDWPRNAFPKGVSGNPGGRPAGALNKFPTEAKAILLEAIDLMGGAARLEAWAKASPENERDLWTALFPRLLPKVTEEHATVQAGPLQRVVEHYLIHPDGRVAGENELDELAGWPNGQREH